MEVHEGAFGPCASCGDLVEEKSEFWSNLEKKMKPGSLYWTPPSQEVWDTVRPLLALHFPGPPQNTWFIHPHCKPFCGPNCVIEYYKKKAAEDCKRGG